MKLCVRCSFESVVICSVTTILWHRDICVRHRWNLSVSVAILFTCVLVCLIFLLNVCVLRVLEWWYYIEIMEANKHVRHFQYEWAIAVRCCRYFYFIGIAICFCEYWKGERARMFGRTTGIALKSESNQIESNRINCLKLYIWERFWMSENNVFESIMHRHIYKSNYAAFFCFAEIQSSCIERLILIESIYWMRIKVF